MGFLSKPEHGLSTKLLQKWHGTYVIIVNFQMWTMIQMCDSKKSEQTVNVNRIKKHVDPENRPNRDGEDIAMNIDPIENSDNKLVKM